MSTCSYLGTSAVLHIRIDWGMGGLSLLAIGKITNQYLEKVSMPAFEACLCTNCMLFYYASYLMFSQAMWSSIKKTDLPESFRVCHPFINHLVYTTVYGKGDF